MISLRGVKKSYGRGSGLTRVLKGVDLEIPDGSFSVILGASGSGKTTLLNVMSGLERPDEGSVRVDGQELSGLTDRELTAFRKRTVGFVFQQYYLLPDLTVEKNVRMGADLAGNPDFSGILEAVGLGDKRKKYPGELSGGEQQRVSLPGPWPSGPKCCSPTSLPGLWTSRPVVRSWMSWPGCGRSWALPWSWSPTIRTSRRWPTG